MTDEGQDNYKEWDDLNVILHSVPDPVLTEFPAQPEQEMNIVSCLDLKGFYAIILFDWTWHIGIFDIAQLHQFSVGSVIDLVQHREVAHLPLTDHSHMWDWLCDYSSISVEETDHGWTRSGKFIFCVGLQIECVQRIQIKSIAWDLISFYGHPFDYRMNKMENMVYAFLSQAENVAQSLQTTTPVVNLSGFFTSLSHK